MRSAKRQVSGMDAPSTWIRGFFDATTMTDKFNPVQSDDCTEE